MATIVDSWGYREFSQEELEEIEETRQALLRSDALDEVRREIMHQNIQAEEARLAQNIANQPKRKMYYY